MPALTFPKQQILSPGKITSSKQAQDCDLRTRPCTYSLIPRPVLTTMKSPPNRVGVDRTNSPLSVTALFKGFEMDSVMRGAGDLVGLLGLPDALSSQSMRKQGGTSVKSVDSRPRSEQETGQLDLDSVAFAGRLLWPEKTWAGIDQNVGPFLYKGSFVAMGLWVLGIFLVYTLSPVDSFEYLEGAERTANLAVLTVLICTNVSRFLHLIIRDKSFVFVNTGVMFGAMAVQIMAIASIALMLAFPTPVLIDPVTGIRSHMVRWVEWTVLAFLMTFLTESIDMPLKDSGGPKIAWIHGVAIGLSTSAGGIFPFCKTWAAWLTVFTVAWLLFCSLFYRLYIRYHRFIKMPTDASVGSKKDEYERAKYSLKIIAVCTVVWTLLAACFSVIAIVQPFVANDSFFASESLVLVTESVFEVISKVWYLSLLVEVHNKVFDDASRAMRRLEELRVVMSTIWNTSSDVMVWCSLEGERVHAVVSPSFFDLGNPPTDAEKLRRLAPYHKHPTLVLDVDKRSGSFLHDVIELDLSSVVTRQEAVDLMLTSKQKDTSQWSGNQVTEKNLSLLASLLTETFRSEQHEMVMIKNLHGRGNDTKEGKTIICEAKISKFQTSGLVVLRDISERFECFEAEKKLVEEITARRKDAEANRFTRHEVKNSLLAAIGVLESLRGSSRERRRTSERPDSMSLVLERNDSDESIVVSPQGNYDSAPDTVLDPKAFEDHVGELDNTLRTVLDTIMDHAMSREVIYEEYEVRKERIMVPDVLSNIRRHVNGSSTGTRFSLKAYPSEFPLLGMDPRLLRYIYQNALSNACRYGKKGGAVETTIVYDEPSKEFRMEVVNLPGIGHDDLLEMTHAEVQEKVFSPGVRLHSKSREEHEMSETNSSGDGAWIMKKCARMQKGDCEIRFEPDRTIFSFWCYARAHHSKDLKDPELTCLPPNTWGVVIDDSGIQRKLMDRYLKIAGIDKDRRVVVGKDASEIYGFSDLVVELVESNPDDKFVVIADENLDVLEGAAMHGTVSGSLCLQKILERLDPEDSARVLALVRSANDSAKESDVYKARAHGYLVKAPIDKAGVLNSLQPWWFKRFPLRDEKQDRKLSSSLSSNSLDTEYHYDPFVDIKATLEVLTALSMTSESSLRIRWRSIQDRLQALKGDLKSTIPRGGQDLNRIVRSIDEIRCGGCPDDLREKWWALRREIDWLLDSQQ